MYINGMLGVPVLDDEIRHMSVFLSLDYCMKGTLHMHISRFAIVFPGAR